ncbi:MAG: HAD-IB family phosphatase [Patescibacteria group bacterium]
MMQKPFAVFDIDGTVARTSLFLATVHEMMRRQMTSKEDSDRIHAALDDWIMRRSDGAFHVYEMLCVEVLYKELGNVKISAYESVLDKVIEKFSGKTYKYTTNLIKQLKDEGYMVLAVSGSEQKAVARFCKLHGFDDYIGVDFHRDGFYFTGSATDVVHNKHTYLQELIDRHDLSRHDSIGVGDTKSDIEMLKMVAEPICFNPNKELLEYARKAGWKIVIERKDVVYELDKKGKVYTLS